MEMRPLFTIFSITVRCSWAIPLERCLATGFVRVRESQGNLENWKTISRSGNCQGILTIQEKISESWTELIKSVNLGNVKLWMHPSLMIDYKLHQDAMTFYFHLSALVRKNLKLGQQNQEKVRKFQIQKFARTFFYCDPS